MWEVYKQPVVRLPAYSRRTSVFNQNSRRLEQESLMLSALNAERIQDWGSGKKINGPFNSGESRTIKRHISAQTFDPLLAPNFTDFYLRQIEDVKFLQHGELLAHMHYFISLHIQVLYVVLQRYKIWNIHEMVVAEIQNSQFPYKKGQIFTFTN